MKRNAKVSTAVIRRLPRYYRQLSELQEAGVERISSRALGKSMGLTASQIRQDLFCFGEFGQQGYGYKVAIIDLRNPTRSGGYNFHTLINRYEDICREQPSNLAARAKAEKYAKILEYFKRVRMDKRLQRDRFTQYMQDTYGTQAEYLWADTPDCAVFRHPSSKKWYAIIMTVRSDRLGLPGEELIDVMNVKCGAIMTGSLLSQKGFLPAYHMNKSYWISILLNDSVPDDQIAPLLELSYDSVAPKRKRKKTAPQS